MARYSNAMSQENVEIVRAAIDAGNRQDIEAVLALMGPEPEWVNSPTAIEPGVRRGRDEVAAVMRALSESLTDARWEVDRIYIALGRLSRRMPGSDARLEDRSLMSYKIRSRKIVQIQLLGFGRDEVQAALEAAGLSA
jgi:SnoaL-like domain